jgi:hypothetical protein
MKLIITFWILSSAITFSLLASSGTYGALGTGANSWSGHGWPSGWLSRHQFHTCVVHPDGEMETTEYWVKWRINSWVGLLTAFAVSASSPAIVFAPIIARKQRKRKTANQRVDPTLTDAI